MTIVDRLRAIQTSLHWFDDRVQDASTGVKFISGTESTHPNIRGYDIEPATGSGVYKRDEKRLRFVHHYRPGPPGDEVAGVDLGVCNLPAVSFGGDSMFYAGSALKQDE